MIKFEELKKVCSELETTPIKGKKYVEVNKRVMAFRELEPNGSITTDIISIENGVVVMKAIIAGSDGIVLATGTASEKESDGFINKTSYIENCETSAVGRALGFLGIGIDTSIASAEERKKSLREKLDVDQMENICLLTKKAKVKEADVCGFYGIDNYVGMSVDIYEKACKKLETTIKAHEKENGDGN